MKPSEAWLKGLNRGAPLIILFLFSCCSTIQFHFTLVQKGDSQRSLVVALVILVLSLAWTFFYTKGLENFPSSSLKDFLVIFQIAYIGFLLFFSAPVRNALNITTEWEWVLLASCLFNGMVQSQRSYLLATTFHSILWMTVLLLNPSLGSGILFLGFILLSLFIIGRLKCLKTEFDYPAARKPRWTSLATHGGLMIGLTLAAYSSGSALLPFIPETVPLKFRETQTVEEFPLDSWLINNPNHHEATSWNEPVKLNFRRELGFGNIKPSAGLLSDDTVLFEVSIKDSEGNPLRGESLPLYWKSASLNHYANGKWTLLSLARQKHNQKLDNLHRTQVVQNVHFVQKTDRSLFMLYPVDHLSISGVETDSEGTWILKADEHLPSDYQVQSSILNQKLSSEIRISRGILLEDYLEVPSHIKSNSLFLKTVDQIAFPGMSPFEQMNAAQRHFEAFQYNLCPKLEKGDPTLQFLEAREGHCQHFASALCLVLRHLGIPSRIGIGFSRGDWNNDRKLFVVRLKHAHAWVEVMLEGDGWVIVDPAVTPSSSVMMPPSQEVSSRFNPERQTNLLQTNQSISQKQPSPSLALVPPAETPNKHTPQPHWKEQPQSPHSAVEIHPFLKRIQKINPQLILFGILLFTIFVLVLAMVGFFQFLKARAKKQPVRVENPSKIKQLMQTVFPFIPQKLKSDARSTLVEIYLEVIQRFKSSAIQRFASETPNEFAWRLKRQHPWLTPRFMELTELFIQARYSLCPIGNVEIEEARRAQKDCFASLKNSKSSL